MQDQRECLPTSVREGLHNICFKCGIYGHNVKLCPKDVQESHDRTGRYARECGGGGGRYARECGGFTLG